MCQCHKIALFTQVQSMKSEQQQPTLIPSPLPFVCLGSVDYGEFFKVLSISTYPFFHRGFELAWNCKTLVENGHFAIGPYD
jgi:hypothetical protein